MMNKSQYEILNPKMSFSLSLGTTSSFVSFFPRNRNRKLTTSETNN